MRGLGGATRPREPHGGLGLARRTMEAANRAAAVSSPARLGPSGDGAPGVARRREQAGYARLVLVELRALSSSPGGAWLRRIDGVNAGGGGA
jgi:hypothetical protein